MRRRCGRTGRGSGRRRTGNGGARPRRSLTRASPALALLAFLGACDQDERPGPPATTDLPGDTPSEAYRAPVGGGDLSDRFPAHTWVRLAPLNVPRTELAAAALEGRVYVVGGLRGGNVNEIYDPVTNTWSRGADLPVFTHHPWAAAARGRVYVGDGVSNRVFAYDPATDAWTEVASSGYRHGDTPAVGVIDGRIYVAGGLGEEMVGNEVEVYDPSTDRWSVLAPMSCPRNHAAGGVIDGRLHVAGGRLRGRSLRLTCHEVFDPGTNAWSTRADLPTGRSGIAGAAVGGRFYVFGGEIDWDAPGRVFDVVEAYDPESDTWTRMTSMPTGRHGIFAAVIGNTIYLPGGARGNTLTPVMEAYVAEGERP